MKERFIDIMISTVIIMGAWKWAIYHFKMFGTRTGIYRCRYCKKYHLSRKCGFTPVKRLLTN